MDIYLIIYIVYERAKAEMLSKLRNERLFATIRLECDVLHLPHPPQDTIDGSRLAKRREVEFTYSTWESSPVHRSVKRVTDGQTIDLCLEKLSIKEIILAESDLTHRSKVSRTRSLRRSSPPSPSLPRQTFQIPQSPIPLRSSSSNDSRLHPSLPRKPEILEYTPPRVDRMLSHPMQASRPSLYIPVTPPSSQRSLPAQGGSALSPEVLANFPPLKRRWISEDDEDTGALDGLDYGTGSGCSPVTPLKKEVSTQNHEELERPSSLTLPINTESSSVSSVYSPSRLEPDQHEELAVPHESTLIEEWCLLQAEISTAVFKALDIEKKLTDLGAEEFLGCRDLKWRLEGAEQELEDERRAVLETYFVLRDVQRECEHPSVIPRLLNSMERIAPDTN